MSAKLSLCRSVTAHPAGQRPVHTCGTPPSLLTVASSLPIPYTLRSRSEFVTTACVTGTAAVSFQPSLKKSGTACGVRRAGAGSCAKAPADMARNSAARMHLLNFIKSPLDGEHDYLMPFV